MLTERTREKKGRACSNMSNLCAICEELESKESVDEDEDEPNQLFGRVREDQRVQHHVEKQWSE